MTPFHSIGQSIRDLLQSIPLEVVRAGILTGLLLLLVWVLRRPRTETVAPEAEGGSVDLRWSAAAALLLQFAIYALL